MHLFYSCNRIQIFGIDQGGHHAACLKEDSFPQCKCGNKPPPPPGPATDVYSCIVAKTAFAKAQQVLGSRSSKGIANVYNSLDHFMSLSKCPNMAFPQFAEPSKALPMPATFRPRESWQASTTLFVSPTGSDTTV